MEIWKLQLGKAALLMTSRDRGVQFVSRSILDKEARFKVAKFKPVTFVQQVFAADPGASSKSLSLRSKKCVQADEVAERLAYSATLKVQGQIFELVDGIAPTIWSKAVQSLSSGLMKFALNAAQDTLPHNVNLAHWHNLSDTCKLCRGRQTLLHLLNNCPVALQCRRYNQRHDLVLTEITTLLTEVLDSDYTIVSDLAGADTYTFPPILAATDLRPDIVVFSEVKQHATIIELTVPFESNLPF